MESDMSNKDRLCYYTEESDAETQKKGPDNESSVPFMDIVDEHHAQKQENNTVTCGTEHFDKVFDGRVRLA